MFFGNFDPTPFLTFRSVGDSGHERFGLGVMDKSGKTVDFQNFIHPGYVIVLVLRGRGVYRTANGAEYALEPGSVFQRFKGIMHSNGVDPDSRWLECFLETGDSVASILQNYGFSDPSVPVLKKPLSPVLLEQFQELRGFFLKDSYSEFLTRMPAIIDWAQCCLRREEPTGSDARYRELIEKACVYLERDFSQDTDLQEFCRHHGCGYENLRKLFKRQVGISPNRYRQGRRLDLACTWLIHSGFSITEIASRLGYSSPYEFSAQFKRYFGCPPTRYRPRFSCSPERERITS